MRLKRPLLTLELLEGRITPAAPVATDFGPVAVLHDQAAYIDVIAQISDADHDPLSISIVQGPSHGHLDFNSYTCLYAYTADLHYIGPDSFSFQGNDGVLDSNIATASINVTDQAPTASDLSISVLHGHAVYIDLAAQVADPDGETPNITIAQQPIHGSLDFNPYINQWIYTANYNYSGPDSFSFAADDNVLDSNIATASIDVTDQGPTASDLSVSVLHGHAVYIDLAAQVADSDGETPNISIVQQPNHGSLDFNPYTGLYTYTADINYTGPASFSFRANDNVLDSEDAIVSISVTDQAPTASDLSVSVLHGHAVYIDLAAQVSDPDGDTLNISIVQQPIHGNLDFNPYTGLYTYTANANYIGPDSFSFGANDNVFDSNIATASINVTNQAPTASDLSIAVLHGRSVYIDLAAQVADPDGDTLNVSIVQEPNHGQLDFNPYIGLYIYTAYANYPGPDSFSFLANDNVFDSNIATASIDVTDQAPTASDLRISVLHGHAVYIDLAAQVADPDGETPNYSIVQQPVHGQLDFNSYTGLYTYTANVNYTGADSFTFQANDNVLDSAEATVSIDVTNHAPIGASQEFFLHAGGTLSVDATSGLLHDSYDADSDSLTVEQVGTGPAHGTLNLQSDGSFTFTANAHFSGVTTFSFRLFDGAAYSDTLTATIHVLNQPPVASADSFDVWIDQGILTGTANVLANDRDPDGDTLTAVIVANPDPAYTDSFQLNADGSFSFVPTTTPPTNWDGEVSFTYQAYDGTDYSDITTVSLHVTAMPVAKDDSYLVDGSGYLFVSAVNGILANDFNPMNAPVNFELVDGIAADVGTLAMNTDGSFSFTAGANFQDQATFSYRWLIQNGIEFFPGPTAVVRIMTTNATTGLYSVAFNSNATIVKDSDGVAYPSRQWQIAMTFGEQVVPAQAGPISFTRNTKIELTPSFDVNYLMVPFWLALGDNILVRAQSTSPAAQIQQLTLGYDQNVRLQIVRTDDIINGGYRLSTLGPVQMDNLLADRTAFYQLILSWQISPDGGLTWITPGGAVTSNQTFVTLADPVGGGAIPLSVFYVGTEGGNNGLGATDNASLVSMIWSAFETRAVTSADGTALKYYGNWNTQVGTTAALLSERDGQCDAWIAFFSDALRAWGDSEITNSNTKLISTNRNVQLLPTPATLTSPAFPGGLFFERFLVGNWQFMEPNIPSPNIALPQQLQGYTHFNKIDNPVYQFINNQWRYVTLGNPAVTEEPGVAGQNNSNPASDFANHKVMLIDGVLYDPSYGVTYAYNANTPLLGFVNAAVDGLVLRMPFNERQLNFDLDGDGVLTTYWVDLFRSVAVGRLDFK